MAIGFVIRLHSIRPGVQIVEIQKDGETIGVVYPNDAGDGIRIVSAHIGSRAIDKDFAGEVIFDDGRQAWPPIPHVGIVFRPSPWMIDGDRIVRPSSGPTP